MKLTPLADRVILKMVGPGAQGHHFGHSMGGRLASLYPQQKGGIAALVLWSPANGAGLNGLEFLNIDDFSAVEAMAAEAEAESILKVQQAMADSMRMLNENAPNDQVIKLKALEALEKVADGKATKLIIPSEIQGLAGLAASAKMLVENDAPAAE